MFDIHIQEYGGDDIPNSGKVTFTMKWYVHKGIVHDIANYDVSVGFIRALHGAGNATIKPRLATSKSGSDSKQPHDYVPLLESTDK